MSNDTIKLSSGLKTYNLIFTDRDDDTVQISFNPNDIGILERIDSAKDRITEAIKDAPEEFTEASEAATKLREIIYEQVDYIFGNTIADKVFKHCHPMAVNEQGAYYIERFIEAVIPIMKRDVEAANKAGKKRMAKHLGKYKK